jgi:hypothetical protein
MNRFLEQLASLYTPMRLRGLLMDGQYRFAPDQPTPGVPTRHPRAPGESRFSSGGSRFSGDPAAAGRAPKRAPIVAEAAPTGACSHRFASLHR